MQVKEKEISPNDLERLKKSITKAAAEISAEVRNFFEEGNLLALKLKSRIDLDGLTEEGLSEFLKEKGIENAVFHLKTKDGGNVYFVAVDKENEKEIMSELEKLSKGGKNGPNVEEVAKKMSDPVIVNDVDLKEKAFVDNVESYAMVTLDARIAQMVKEEAEKRHLLGEPVPKMSLDFYPTREGSKGEIRFLDTPENQHNLNKLVSISCVKAMDPQIGPEILKLAEKRMNFDNQIRRFAGNPKAGEFKGLTIMDPARYLGDKSQPYLTFDGARLRIGENGKERTIPLSNKKEFYENLYKTLDKMNDKVMLKGLASKKELDKEDPEKYEKTKSSEKSLKEKHRKMLREKEEMISKLYAEFPAGLADEARPDFAGIVAAHTTSQGKVSGLSYNRLAQDFVKSINDQELDNYMNAPEDHIHGRNGDNTLENGGEFINIEAVKIMQKTERRDAEIDSLAPEYDPVEERAKAEERTKGGHTRTSKSIRKEDNYLIEQTTTERSLR